MSITLKRGGFYVGIDTGTGEAYADRPAAGAWEQFAVTKRQQWFDIKADAANRQLCVNEQTKQLESRAAGDIEGWGGQWDVQQNAAGVWTATVPGAQTLTLEGYKVAPVLTPLHVVDRDFVDATGQRYTVIGSTELLMAWRYDLEGPDALKPTMLERQDLGFNNLRVLWQKDINNSGRPWQMPLDKLKPFLKVAADFGFYIQGTILADCQAVNPSVANQQRRVADVRAATAGVPNLLEQLGNEANKNGHDPRNFQRPTDRLAANSSSTTGGADYPYWDFFCFSGRRDPCNSWIRENGPVEFMYSNGRPWGGVPAICDEGAKPGVHPAGDYRPRDWERAGAQGRSGCGARLHTLTGTGDQNQPHIIPSGLFSPFERECATAFVKGLKG